MKQTEDVRQQYLAWNAAVRKACLDAAFAVVFALTLCSCGSSGGLDAGIATEPYAVEIETDSSRYRLQYEPRHYTLRMSVDVTNTGRNTLFLHRECDFGSQPGRSMVRTDTLYKANVPLYGLGCVLFPVSRPPIALAPGATFVDQIAYVISVSPDQDPPFNIDQATGEFYLVYLIKKADAEDWRAGDALPLEDRRSNTFVVEPPKGR